MDAEDQALRDQLAREGSLFSSYHPRMEALHVRNATRLKAIIREFGWPGEKLVGAEGAVASWRILQHSISDPAFMRSSLPLLWVAAKQGEIPGWQPAYLEDRIRMYEGRPQLYGSQFWLDEHGESQPYEIEDPATVDQRRKEVGLGPLSERIDAMRAADGKEPKQTQEEYAKFLREYKEWLRKTGWR